MAALAAAVAPMPLSFTAHLISPVLMTLTALDRLGLDEVNMLNLKTAGLVGELVRVVKIIKTGEIKRAVKLNGIGATAGAKAAIEAAGGSVA